MDVLAEKAGLPGKHIGEIERGEMDVTDQSLELVADALNMSLHEHIQYDW